MNNELNDQLRLSFISSKRLFFFKDSSIFRTENPLISGKKNMVVLKVMVYAAFPAHSVFTTTSAWPERVSHMEVDITS